VFTTILQLWFPTSLGFGCCDFLNTSAIWFYRTLLIIMFTFGSTAWFYSSVWVKFRVNWKKEKKNWLNLKPFYWFYGNFGKTGWLWLYNVHKKTDVLIIGLKNKPMKKNSSHCPACTDTAILCTNQWSNRKVENMMMKQVRQSNCWNFEKSRKIYGSNGDFCCWT
jgi:hypothetical protein